jgi:hypothetical protein
LALALSFLVPMMAQSLQATVKTDWANLKRLAQGQEIQVVLNDAKSYVGKFQSVTDDAIVIRLTTGDQIFTRQSVLRVSSKRQGHRGRNAALGGAIGAGAGLAIGAAVDQSSNGFTGNRGKAIATPGIAILGAAIGAALPTGSWQEVYGSR